MTTIPSSPTCGERPNRAAAPPGPSIWAGSWYFLVTIVSAGLLAWVPFVHAAIRLRGRAPRVLAVLYALAAILLAVLLSSTPVDAPDMTAADNTVGVVTGWVMSCIVSSALMAQVALRRRIYSS